jgi:hypothetical protein
VGDSVSSVPDPKSFQDHRESGERDSGLRRIGLGKLRRRYDWLLLGGEEKES